MDQLRIYTHSQCASHDTGHGHPECAERLTRIMDMIHNDFPDIHIETAFPANEETVLLAHPQSHLDMILDNTPFDGLAYIDGDTVLSPASYDSALLGVGASCQGVDAVMAGETQTAFAAIRPPGHHAEYDRAMGFCLFANAFIAARHAQEKHNVNNILIVDFDVHHGNGTADLVRHHVNAGHKNIAYASTHQSPLFPGTGIPQVEGNADGMICDCPLSAGSNSEIFRRIINNTVLPFAKDFAPDLIIFSAGFDAHETDPIGGLALQHDDFAWIVNRFKPLCPKMVSVLEGGYNLDTLATSVKAHLKALSGMA